MYWEDKGEWEWDDHEMIMRWMCPGSTYYTDYMEGGSIKAVQKEKW